MINHLQPHVTLMVMILFISLIMLVAVATMRLYWELENIYLIAVLDIIPQLKSRWLGKEYTDTSLRDYRRKKSFVKRLAEIWQPFQRPLTIFPLNEHNRIKILKIASKDALLRCKYCLELLPENMTDCQNCMKEFQEWRTKNSIQIPHAYVPALTDLIDFKLCSWFADEYQIDIQYLEVKDIPPELVNAEVQPLLTIYQILSIDSHLTPSEIEWLVWYLTLEKWWLRDETHFEILKLIRWLATYISVQQRVLVYLDLIDLPPIGYNIAYQKSYVTGPLIFEYLFTEIMEQQFLSPFRLEFLGLVATNYSPSHFFEKMFYMWQYPIDSNRFLVYDIMRCQVYELHLTRIEALSDQSLRQLLK